MNQQAVQTASQAIQWRNDGLISDAECISRLEEMQIRGGFDGLRFCGYDYKNQRWIEG